MNTLSKSFVTGTLALVLFTSFTASVQAVAGQWSSNGSNIYYNDGFVGLGTNKPYDALHIVKSSTTNKWGSALVGTDRGGLWLRGSLDSTSGSTAISANAYNNNGWYKRTPGYEAWVTGTYQTQNDTGYYKIFHVDSGANQSPLGSSLKTVLKLDSKGTLYTREIVVSNTWADYVFDNNYELMPLKEIETFVNNNNHLPGVPSANELVKDGIPLGDMQRIHMEKIEELTLHLIEKDKQIDSLKERLSRLEDVVAKL